MIHIVKNPNYETMPIEKHDLLHEFPEHRKTIHQLKISEYHEVDKEVHRIEENIETPSDDYTQTTKIKRLALKDELHKMILAAR
ncbi:MAG: DUF465 domain-containing protein [Akkermansiaceae bacterium]